MHNQTGAAACDYCGVGHVGRCPLVKAVEYYENGSVKRIEFHAVQPLATSGIPISESIKAALDRAFDAAAPNTACWPGRAS